MLIYMSEDYDCYQDPDWLAISSPPNRLFVGLGKLGYRFTGRPEQSMSVQHERGLWVHRRELLRREDTTPRVKSYILGMQRKEILNTTRA